MEKAVKGATKIKLAAPKSKYVEAILSATNGGENGVAEVFRTLQLRLRDSTWTIVFKALIIVHFMIREGQADVTLRYIAESPKRLAISSFTEAYDNLSINGIPVQTQGSNIRRYSEYLLERVRGYRDTKVDIVRLGSGRLKKLTVDKGLLRETESVQHQINALIKCDLLGAHDPDNEISLTAFRLLTMDLMELFKIMNEGTINVLEHYFEMSRPDAERALNIYKTFGRQTDQVVQYLSMARQYETSTRLEVPNLKHAPTTLTSSLEEYLNDPDFEINRRQYLAQQQGKGQGNPSSSSKPVPTPFDTPSKASQSAFPPPQGRPPSQQQQQAKGPAPDLIDFFESIEQNQQPMAQQVNHHSQFAPNVPQQASQYPQSNFLPQQTGYNPFLQQAVPQQPQPLQPDFTGAGFGGYTPQPQQMQPTQPQPQQHYAFQSQLSSIPQNGVADFQNQQQQHQQRQPQLQPLQPQQTSTNPFRQSMMQTGSNVGLTSPNRQSTNPFKPQNTVFQAQAQGVDLSSSFSDNSSSPYNTFTASPQAQSQDFTSIFPQNPQSTSPQQVQQPQFPLQPQRTGTNPFAKNRSPPPAASPLVANPTGSTNPFRQSAFVNQATGQGWQHSNQGTLAGFDLTSVQTQAVFPRPGQL